MNFPSAFESMRRFQFKQIRSVHRFSDCTAVICSFSNAYSEGAEVGGEEQKDATLCKTVKQFHNYAYEKTILLSFAYLPSLFAETVVMMYPLALSEEKKTHTHTHTISTVTKHTHTQDKQTQRV